MKISTSGIIGIEGPDALQARSSLRRICARSWTHNPEGENRAGKPEQYQHHKPRSRANLCGQRATETAISYVTGGEK